MKKIVLLCSLACVLTGAVHAQNKADLERQRAAIQREIDDVKRSLDETKKNRKETIGKLTLVQRKLQLRMAEIGNINQQINLIDGDINQSYKDIGKLKKDLDTLKAQYQKSVLYAYKNRSNYYFLNFIFSASSFNDAVRRVAYLRSYRNYREEQVTTIEHTQEILQEKITGLSENKAKKTVVLNEENKQRMVLEVEKKEKDVIVSKLKAREKELSSEIAAKKKQDQKLSSAIVAAIRRATEAAAKEAARKKAEALANASKNAPAATAAPSTAPVAKNETRVIKAARSPLDDDPAARALSDDFEKNRGSLPWPIGSGSISMHFGVQKVPGLEHVQYDNPGLTFETDAGQSVKAVFDGEVSYIFYLGEAQSVIIKHGKYFTTYSNLDNVGVSKGQAVKRGQVIGKVAEKNGDGELDFLISNERQQNLNPELWLRH